MESVASGSTRKRLLAGPKLVSAVLALVGVTQLMGCGAHSALPLGLAVEDPAPPLPSGTQWACPQALAGPVRLARDGQMLVVVSLDTNATANLVWPRGFSARLLDGRAELIARDGSVIAREGDVLGDLGGGGTGDGFHVCSVAETVYGPIP